MRKLFIAMAAALMVTACSSSGNDPDNGSVGLTDSDGNSIVAEDGTDVNVDSGIANDGSDGNSYNVELSALTATGVDGGTCPDGSGNMVASDGRITGNILTTTGFSLSMTGFLDDDGVIDITLFEGAGGSNNPSDVWGSMEGDLVGSSAMGSWLDLTFCTGQWSATLN